MTSRDEGVMIRYDEPQLVKDLDRIAPALRVAFAATCAERLFPAYRMFFEQTGHGNPGLLRGALDRLWAALSDRAIGAIDFTEEVDACMAEIQREDDGTWSPARSYAEDAAAAIAYALRAARKGDSQEAAWAARRAYESLDHFVINTCAVDVGRPGGEERVLQHPLIQAELWRQKRDREMLLAADPRAEGSLSTIKVLRDTAFSEAPRFFGSEERP